MRVPISGCLVWLAVLCTGLPVCSSSAMAASPPRASGPSISVNVNQASLEDLRSIRGVGPARAQRILAERARGPFRDLDDLSARVPGIGAGTARALARNGLKVPPAVSNGVSDNQGRRP